jgi:hypothetical protein
VEGNGSALFPLEYNCAIILLLLIIKVKKCRAATSQFLSMSIIGHATKVIVRLKSEVDICK